MENNNKVFIPVKLKAGFQERKDTYTQKLSYIIYWDSKNVLRKEKSFNGWVDSKIPTMEFENVPTEGFVLNKSIKRSSEWFGNGRNMIRVYDPRGLEFEITTGNLLFILMNSDCNKRELVGSFVYGWWGTELVLLPTNCEEYENSTNFTKMQSLKVSKKDIKEGYWYVDKSLKKKMYVGSFYNYYYKKGKYDRESRKNLSNELNFKRKDFVFWDGKKYEILTSLTSISEQISTEIDGNFSEIYVKYENGYDRVKSPVKRAFLAETEYFYKDVLHRPLGDKKRYETTYIPSELTNIRNIYRNYTFIFFDKNRKLKAGQIYVVDVLGEEKYVLDTISIKDGVDIENFEIKYHEHFYFDLYFNKYSDYYPEYGLYKDYEGSYKLDIVGDGDIYNPEFNKNLKYRCPNNYGLMLPEDGKRKPFYPNVTKEEVDSIKVCGIFYELENGDIVNKLQKL